MKIIQNCLVLLALLALSFSGNTDREVAYQHVQNLKEGVLLVRLHQQDILLAKMKHHGLDKQHKYKKAEIFEKNKASYDALSELYSFSEIAFFYGSASSKIKSLDYSGVFLGEDLQVDTSIHISQNVPVYILDVGDIYFPEMSGHQEGVVVMDSEFEPLTDPFPYYVRRRSGMAIIKRTDTDIAILLHNKLTNFYNKSMGIDE